MEQITKTLVSASIDAPIELDLAQLAFVSGGLPKGTWGTQSLPKGTWEASLPKGTWESSLPKGTWEA